MQRTTQPLVRPGLIGPRSLIKTATVLHLDRAINVAAADAAGTLKLNMSNTPNTRLIHQIHEQWARDNGYRPQAPSVKLSNQPVRGTRRKPQAPGHKHQAPSPKPQAL